jgi:hypothetical protein
MKDSQQPAELELGPELSRYRRRPELEILRSLGLSTWTFYYYGPIYAVLLSLFLSMPVVFLAKHLGAAPPILKDPTWGPISIGWYCACVLMLLWFMYGLPRREFLAIHRDGFVLQGRFRRYTIRFRDIVECHMISASVDKILDPKTLRELDKGEYRIISAVNTFRLVLVDKTQLSWKGMLNLFPPEAAVQLLNQIQFRKSGRPNVSKVDHVLKRQLRLVGLFVGLLLDALVVYAPASDEKCREVTRKAFGAVFCGLPCEIAVPILMGVLFVPLIFVCPQLMVLIGRGAGLYERAEIRRAWLVSIASGVYFLILMAMWMIYTSALGI